MLHQECCETLRSVATPAPGQSHTQRTGAGWKVFGSYLCATSINVSVCLPLQLRRRDGQNSPSYPEQPGHTDVQHPRWTKNELQKAEKSGETGGPPRPTHQQSYPGGQYLRIHLTEVLQIKRKGAWTRKITWWQSACCARDTQYPKHIDRLAGSELKLKKPPREQREIDHALTHGRQRRRETPQWGVQASG